MVARSLGALALMMLFPGLAVAADAITVVEVLAERSTIHTAGIQVLTSDDDNRDATIDVRVRALGQTAWTEAPALFRVWPETVGISVPEQLAGSIFDLEPDTTYEVELHVVDPDGVDESITTTVSTRPLPSDPAAPNVVDVADAAQLTAALSSAAPGDVIMLAPGSYVGAFQMTASGTADNPIVIRGADAASVVLDGNDCGGCNVLEIYGSWVHVEDLTMGHAVRALRFQGEGATGNVARGVIIEDVVHGIGSRPGQSDFYVCDNEIHGRLEWPWVYDADASSHWDDRGIDLQGDGHVVCHNFVAGFGDPIMNQEEGFRAFDVYGNDVWDTYDGIEVDRGAGNVRVFRNRWVNSHSVISIQPIHGGPLYVLRNEMLNVVGEQIKMKGTGGEPSGSIIAHNTCVSPRLALNLQTPITGHNFRIENNLFVGPEQLTGNRTVEWTGAVNGGVFDYNGYYPDGGLWFGVVDGMNRLYDSLASAMASGEVETNGVLLGTPIFSAGIVGPVDGMVAARSADLQLADGSNAIDVGRVLAGISDEFEGAGPDLGARERGCPTPRFGPRAGGDADGVSPVNCPSQEPGGDDETGDGGDAGDAGDDETGGGGTGASSSATAGEAGGEDGTDAGSADTTAGQRDDDDGCGCRTSARAQTWWLLALLAIRRRRTVYGYRQTVARRSRSRSRSRSRTTVTAYGETGHDHGPRLTEDGPRPTKRNGVSRCVLRVSRSVFRVPWR
jgi:hypothetical protein